MASRKICSPIFFAGDEQSHSSCSGYKRPGERDAMLAIGARGSTSVGSPKLHSTGLRSDHGRGRRGSQKIDVLVSSAGREEFLVRYREAATFIPIISRIEACRDARDNKFLDLAIDGKADLIVTGDDDLLVLDPFQDVRILSAQGFLALNSGADLPHSGI